MHQSNSKFSTPLLLHLLLVVGIVLNIWCSFCDSVVVEWIRWEQQQVVKKLPENSPLTVTLELSQLEFLAVQWVKRDECIVSGDIFDVVSVSQNSTGYVLTLLPDLKENIIQKRMGNQMAASRPSNPQKRIPVSGFLFFENREIHLVDLKLLERKRPLAFAPSVCAGYCATNKPPPRHTRSV